MSILDDIFAKASANPKHIVLAEGLDPRIITGAVKAAMDGLANITLIGPVEEVRALTRDAGDTANIVHVADPDASKHLADFARVYQYLNPKRIRNLERAESALKAPLNFANMMVQQGLCDGSLAGAVNTSSDVIRSAQRILGLQSDHDMISSFFIMLLPGASGNLGNPLIFADCCWVVTPDAAQLAEIAAATAMSAKKLINLDPRIALLSFSTGESASHPRVKKIDKARQILAERFPDLTADGPLQFDTAINESVARLKAPGSKIAGYANILIFPNLEAGNIGYKIAERLGGAVAIGPIFQGLAKPSNDLSRGCNAEDVYNMIAVTAVQAQNNAREGQ